MAQNLCLLLLGCRFLSYSKQKATQAMCAARQGACTAAPRNVAKTAAYAHHIVHTLPCDKCSTVNTTLPWLSSHAQREETCTHPDASLSQLALLESQVTGMIAWHY